MLYGRIRPHISTKHSCSTVNLQPHRWATYNEHIKNFLTRSYHLVISHPLLFFPRTFFFVLVGTFFFLNITQWVTINGWHFSLLATWQNTRVNTRSEWAAEQLDNPANNKAQQGHTSQNPEGELQREMQPQLLKLMERKSDRQARKKTGSKSQRSRDITGGKVSQL